MSHELVRAIRSVYDDVDGSETRQPSRAKVATLWSLLQQPAEARYIVALWSAARCLVYPQIDLASRVLAAQAIAATRAHLEAPAAVPLPLQAVDALNRHVSQPGTADPT